MPCKVFPASLPDHAAGSMGIDILRRQLRDIFYSQPVLNTLFAACGIIGSRYGIGQKFSQMDGPNIEAAMFGSGGGLVR
ncbi:hypothetical protein BBP40_002226 [Aspergillus hancockii]|nr:hypothetical protein BBP40_002226 [Aspergillus hancockii]